jgi:solute carrier family 30 (zinc transporter), member 2
MENPHNYKKFNGVEAQSAEKNHSHDMSEKAKKKLIIVCLVCSCFMIIEFIGGLLANSVAIMTDAAHLLSDLGGFVISIFALYLAKFPADKTFTYGYHRAEIIGAILSVFLIWILTILLLSESIQRLFTHHHVINGGIMLATSTIGLVFNCIMAYILHSSVNFYKLNKIFKISKKF